MTSHRARRDNPIATVECIEDVTYPKYTHIIQFTKGKQYISSRKKSGIYEIENDVEALATFTPEQYTKHFKEVK